MAFETIKTDLLVIGGGVAGLRAAVAAAEKGVSVLLVSKGGYLGGPYFKTTGRLG